MGLRGCSNGRAPLTVMPTYDKEMIIKNTFFKTKNCSNDDDLFISCNDRIGKKCFVTSAYLQWLFHSGERAVALMFLLYPTT